MRPRRFSFSWTLLLAPAFACATGPGRATPATIGGSQPVPPALFPGASAPTALRGDIPFVSLEGPLRLAAQGALVFSDVVEANAAGRASTDSTP